jgi:hypothetical protein
MSETAIWTTTTRWHYSCDLLCYKADLMDANGLDRTDLPIPIRRTVAGELTR